MPKSKPSARRRAAARRPAGGPQGQSRSRRFRIRGNRWVTLPLIIGGLALFLMGNIGARTGIVFIPLDPHHIVEQFGGALLFFAGLMLL